MKKLGLDMQHVHIRIGGKKQHPTNKLYILDHQINSFIVGVRSKFEKHPLLLLTPNGSLIEVGVGTKDMLDSCYKIYANEYEATFDAKLLKINQHEQEIAIYKITQNRSSDGFVELTQTSD